MQARLDRLKTLLDQAASLPADADTPVEALFEALDPIEAAVRAVSEAITRAVAEGGPAPVTELTQIAEAFGARWRALRLPLSKLLCSMRERLKETLEQITFLDMSRGTSAPCGCAVWRAVAKGGGLAAVPSLPASRVVEAVNDVWESYRVHECGACGSRWLQDFNPDSDPSVTRWWAK